MAESIAHDVVKEALSVGDHLTPSDDIAAPFNEIPAGNGQATHIPSPSPSYDADERDGDAVANHSDEAATVDAVARLVEDSADDADEVRGRKPDSAVASLSDSMAQALADASGGSDTDTSRADPADPNKDSKGHIRTGSVKKPASFKAVSVTKSFLAKSLSASPVVRPGDKGIPNSPSPTSALLSAKPRLVAKSALGGGGKGLTKMNGTVGPDASKVWNKNRPVPPPPPRQFTDEELQTRYGIHMATRLQSDEAGKDSKWADIDDDEDDWAPETVEWMDGTKSNVVAADAQLPPVQPEDQSPALMQTDQPAEPVKPVLTSMQKPIVSQTTKTILRPGAQLSSSPKPDGLHKLGSDKSGSGSSKPSAPPSKSPWAVLPPVEKLAPINPPVQQPQRPFQRDPQGFDALPPAPSPAQEIAADDFSRSWRDDRGTKELFNAQSGRYEPANEARRGSRHEHGSRQPAVLQRPSPGALSNGPAEPSAAFQTSRLAGEGGAPWSRRRASSSLSAAGGRRPSLALSQDHSQQPLSDVAVESPRSAFATVDRPGPWVRGAQPPMEPPLAEGEPQPEEPQEPEEDPVAKQQRLMREKIERAKLAKQKALEAEAAEAAARQERLKIKMAQLAVASPSPEPRDDAVKANSSRSTAVQVPKATAVTPPKPPIPQSEGEVAQYGMMKVHQPHPVKKNFVSEASLTAKSNQDGNAEYGGQAFRGSTSPNKTVTRPTQQQHANSGDKTQGKRGSDAAGGGAAPLDKLAGTWKTSPSPNDYNWGPNTMNARSTVSASVWGPPLSNEKSLGNGTFESKFSHPNFERRLDNRLDNRFDNSRTGLPTQGPLHGPIGSGIKSAPTPPQRQSHFTQTFQNLNLSEKSAQQELLPASPSQSPSVDDQTFASTHLDSSLQQSIAQTSSLHPQATAPLTSKPSYPSSNTNTTNKMASAQVALPPTPALGKGLNSQDRSRQWLAQGGSDHRGWHSFHADEQREKKVDIAKYKQSLAANGEVAQSTPKASATATYEVYRDAGHQVDVYQITIHPDGTKAARRSHSAPMTPNNIAKVRESEAEHPEDHPAKSEQQMLNGLPASTTSSSRFFPKSVNSKTTGAAQDGSLPRTTVAENEAPPPAEQGLFDEAAAQPAKVKFPVIAKVNLPGMRNPSVPLPPRSPGLDKTFQAPTASTPGTQKHITMPNLLRAEDLKAKFGHLHPGGVFANTKPAFDVTFANTRPNGMPRVSSAAPIAPAKPVFAADTSSDVASKAQAEDVCFDFPDFGSKPTVRVPAVPHQNHQFGYSHDSSMLAPTRPHPRYQKLIETQSVLRDESFLFPTEKGANFGSKITIRLDGMKMSKSVDANIKRRGGGGNGSSPSAGAGAGANAFRKTSSTFNPSSRRTSNFPPPKSGSHTPKNENVSTRNTSKPHKPTGGAVGSAGTSSSSSPKPRGHWGPRNGQSGGSAGGN